MDLAEFLLARIAEDEAVAAGWPDDPGPPPPGYAFWVDGHGRPIYQPRARLLAKCEADRRIVALDICTACAVEYQPCDHQDATLRLLALPYADHPEFRQEWRP